jgi:hypothetical protein
MMRVIIAAKRPLLIVCPSSAAFSGARKDTRLSVFYIMTATVARSGSWAMKNQNGSD